MNKNDRTVAVAALCVVVLSIVLLFLFDNGRTTAPAGKTQQYAEQRTGGQRTVNYGPYPKEHRKETFPFDPNTADSTQLLRLGLQPWQVRNIYKYRSRGGIYRKKEDFARLYGLTVKDYRRLEPYIRISSDYLPAATLVGDGDFKTNEANRVDGTNESNGLYEVPPRKIDSTQHIVLNMADTVELRRVPGIGPYYARQIFRYGQRLGGYVSVNQLDEVEGFPQEAKKYFVVQDAHPQQLNVNELTLQQLRRHPYINFYQAKAILDYRRLHGNLNSLQDLRLSRDFPPEEIARLTPYVSF